MRRTLYVAWLSLLAAAPVVAQFGEFEELGMTSATELSLVATEGNSSTETFGFKHALGRTWQRSRYRLRLEGVRASTRDQRFAVVDPTDPGGFAVVEPSSRPDVEKYLIENSYDRRVGDGRVFGNTGITWDRNRDAGILNRYVLFAGTGHLWHKDDRKEFFTTYGLSYTDREETTPDPAKDDTFGGARLQSFYKRQLGAVTTVTHDWRINTNFSDFSDYTSDMTQAVAVSMSKRLAIKLSLQWLYNNDPALETIDLVEIDGTLVGRVNVRKKRTDLVLTTSLVVTF
ncbi:MAG: DUF481 domain-containing protein [Acidobacteriota bacterium]|nr:DUF481 domain-containing protein [Acidobacteriota bacterium]